MADKFAKSFNFGGEDDFYPLPIVSEADNGKVMKVVEGEWIMGELILEPEPGTPTQGTTYYFKLAT